MARFGAGQTALLYALAASSAHTCFNRLFALPAPRCVLLANGGRFFEHANTSCWPHARPPRAGMAFSLPQPARALPGRFPSEQGVSAAWRAHFRETCLPSGIRRFGGFAPTAWRCLVRCPSAFVKDAGLNAGMEKLVSNPFADLPSKLLLATGICNAVLWCAFSGLPPCVVAHRLFSG